MAKVGLKDTLALLAKGYSKKEIDALAANDDENEANPEPDPVPETPPPAPEPDAPADPEPDYKALYEELKKQQEAKDKEIKEKDETIKKIQKSNINENNLPEIEKARLESENSLIDALRSFY